MGREGTGQEAYVQSFHIYVCTIAFYTVRQSCCQRKVYIGQCVGRYQGGCQTPIMQLAAYGRHGEGMSLHNAVGQMPVKGNVQPFGPFGTLLQTAAPVAVGGEVKACPRQPFIAHYRYSQSIAPCLYGKSVAIRQVLHHHVCGHLTHLGVHQHVHRGPVPESSLHRGTHVHIFHLVNKFFPQTAQMHHFQ